MAGLDDEVVLFEAEVADRYPDCCEHPHVGSVRLLEWYAAGGDDEEAAGYFGYGVAEFRQVIGGSERLEFARMRGKALHRRGVKESVYRGARGDSGLAMFAAKNVLGMKDDRQLNVGGGGGGEFALGGLLALRDVIGSIRGDTTAGGGGRVIEGTVSDRLVLSDESGSDGDAVYTGGGGGKGEIPF